MQRPERPAGDQVDPADARPADDHQGEEALGEQLPLDLVLDVALELPGLDLPAVGEAHRVARGELVGGADEQADEEPGQDEQQGTGPDEQHAVEERQPQPQGGPHATVRAHPAGTR